MLQRKDDGALSSLTRPRRHRGRPREDANLEIDESDPPHHVSHHLHMHAVCGEPEGTRPKDGGTDMNVFEGGTRLGRFAQVAQTLTNEYGVSRGQPSNKTFGCWALLVDGKLFALSSVGSHFTVRLPKRRLDELVAIGAGRKAALTDLQMEEWLVVHCQSAEGWIAVAREALRFVRTLD
jgi:hypothetical protein